MGAFSLWQWIVVILIALLLFARPGKISGLMGDVGKGLRNFKAGMRDDNGKSGADKTLKRDAAKPTAKPKPKATKE